MANSISIGRARIFTACRLRSWQAIAAHHPTMAPAAAMPAKRPAECEWTRQPFAAPAACFRKTKESPQRVGAGVDRRS